MEKRLQKILAEAGVASRRGAEKMISEGRVAVDGKIVTEPGTKADEASCEITVDGVPIKEPERKVTFLLYKPKGFISTAKDDRGRKTVLYLIEGCSERVYAVGRLDSDTEGLLVITNDGALMNGLLHPKSRVDKTYVAKVKGSLSAEDMDRLRHGIELEDGLTAPGKVRLLSESPGAATVEITIHEGKNRQVRRMFSALGCEVVSLKRTRFADLDLNGIKRGGFREASQEELRHLYRLAGMDEPNGNK